jgi:hypothetical protein
MSAENETYTARLRADLASLRKTVDAALDAPRVEQATVDRIYALLHNTMAQGEVASSSLVSSICSLACGILRRTKSPDDGTLRVVKAHIDALAIVVEHDVAGDGGRLGQRMVEQLRGLAQAVGA